MSEWKKLEIGQVVERGTWVRISTGDIAPVGLSFKVGHQHTHYWTAVPPPFDYEEPPLPCATCNSEPLVEQPRVGFFVRCRYKDCWSGPLATNRETAIAEWNALMGKSNG